MLVDHRVRDVRWRAGAGSHWGRQRVISQHKCALLRLQSHSTSSLPSRRGLSQTSGHGACARNVRGWRERVTACVRTLRQRQGLFDPMWWWHFRDGNKCIMLHSLLRHLYCTHIHTHGWTLYRRALAPVLRHRTTHTPLPTCTHTHTHTHARSHTMHPTYRKQPARVCALSVHV